MCVCLGQIFSLIRVFGDCIATYKTIADLSLGNQTKPKIGLSLEKSEKWKVTTKKLET